MFLVKFLRCGSAVVGGRAKGIAPRMLLVQRGFAGGDSQSVLKIDFVYTEKSLSFLQIEFIACDLLIDALKDRRKSSSFV